MKETSRFLLRMTHQAIVIFRQGKAIDEENFSFPATYDSGDSHGLPRWKFESLEAPRGNESCLRDPDRWHHARRTTSCLRGQFLDHPFCATPGRAYYFY